MVDPVETMTWSSLGKLLTIRLKFYNDEKGKDRAEAIIDEAKKIKKK